MLLLLTLSGLVLLTGGGNVFHGVFATDTGTDTGTGTPTWDGESYDTSFLMSGTKYDPHVISDSYQLAGLRHLVNNGKTFENEHIIINQDIDLAMMPWTPIGTKANPFLGHISGSTSYITISGIYIENEFEYTGIFGYVGNETKGGSISNLTLTANIVNYDNLNIKNNTNIGVLAGYLSSSSEIYNIIATSTNEIKTNINTSSATELVFGTIVGLNEGTIYNTDAALYTGNLNLTLDDTDNPNFDCYFGGIAGVNKGQIYNCQFFSEDFVTTVLNNDNDINANFYQGGVFGYNLGTVENVASEISFNYGFNVTYDETGFTSNLNTEIGFIGGYSSYGIIRNTYYCFDEDYLNDDPNKITPSTEEMNNKYNYLSKDEGSQINTIVQYAYNDEYLPILKVEGYLVDSTNLLENLNVWVNDNLNLYNFITWVEVSGLSAFTLDIEDSHAHRYELFLEGNILVLQCSHYTCAERYTAKVGTHLAKTIYVEGKPSEPIEIINIDMPEDFVISIRYENNTAPGLATAIIYHANLSVEIEFEITKEEDLNPEEVVEIVESQINDITNDTVTKDDELLNDALSNVSETQKDEILDTSTEKLNEIKDQISNGSEEDIVLKDHANKVYEVVRSAIITVSEKEVNTPKFTSLDDTNNVKISAKYEYFIDNQYENLLLYDYEVPMNNFKQSAAMITKVGTYMANRASAIHECDGTEMEHEINQYITSLSHKVFSSYDEDAADEEFFQMTYQAIMDYLQNETIAIINQEYENNLSSGKYVGSALDQLKRTYEEQIKEVSDDESFRLIVLEILIEKYIVVINSRFEQGLISEEVYNSLLANTENYDTFENVYQDIFRSWALAENNTDITLEELLNAVSDNFGTRPISDLVNKFFTGPEIIVMGSIAFVSVIGLIINLILKRRKL